MYVILIRLIVCQYLWIVKVCGTFICLNAVKQDLEESIKMIKASR